MGNLSAGMMIYETPKVLVVLGNDSMSNGKHRMNPIRYKVEFDMATLIPRNLKAPTAITTAILVGYAIIFISVIGLGFFATKNMELMRETTKNLYEHPFAVSNASRDLKSLLFQIQNQMIRIVMFRKQDDDPEKLYSVVDAYDKIIREDMEVIKANFLGDMEKVQALDTQLHKWKSIRRDEILTAAKRRDYVTAQRLLNNVGTPVFAELVPSIDYVLNFAKNKAKTYHVTSEKLKEEIIANTQFVIGSLAILIGLVGLVIFWRVRRLQNELHRNASVDSLTGVSNRRHFMEVANREVSKSIRYGEIFVLASADLDDFKAINDTYGHYAGDIVLIHFCKVCQTCLRDTDILGRIGGEEFAILLSNTSLAKAQDVIERVRKALDESFAMDENSHQMHITASFGLVECSSDNMDMNTLFKSADKALYDAKHAGRNRICVAAS